VAAAKPSALTRTVSSRSSKGGFDIETSLTARTARDDNPPVPATTSHGISGFTEGLGP